MKYGLIIAEPTKKFNLGDDIWAYAALKFLPQCDYIINRIELNRFKSLNNEDVGVIIAGFLFPHMKEHQFFPPKNIIPKIISLHCRVTATDWIAQDKVVQYLKCNGPVGARDSYTLEKMIELGIDSYFSGCITLTLDRPKPLKQTAPYICLVDLSDEVIKKIKTDLAGSNFEIKVMTHLYDNTALSWEERLKKVRSYLRIYAGAHCVVTSRLHVACPCLSFEIPFLVLKEPFKKDDLTGSRFIPYMDMFHWAYNNDFLAGQCEYSIKDPPKNKKEYLKYKEIIIKETSEWLDLCDIGIVKNNMPDTQEELNEWLIKTYGDEISKIKNFKKNVNKSQK